jgi:hypothetical protein
MAIPYFRDKLVSALGSISIPREIKTEKDLEIRFVIPLVQQISAQERDLHIFTHPWNNKRHCAPDCESAPISGKVKMGCPRCWRESKKWASVAAFGTHHDFDLVARDSRGKTLAVEVKFVGSKGGRKPNSEIQRFLGQCSLAKTKHNAVIGLCVYRGSPDPRWERDTQAMRDWFKRAGIFLIFRYVA